MDDLFKLFGALIGGPAPTIARTEIDGFIVSTVDSMDMGYETAIIDANGTHPVQHYNTEEEAIDGHDDWVDGISKGVRRVTKLGYGSLIPAENIDLVSASKDTN